MSQQNLHGKSVLKGDKQQPHSQNEQDTGPSPLLQMIVSNWKTLTPKRHMRKTLKIYEEQQLQEIPGASKKTGTVMHAAITSEIDNEDHKVDGKLMDTGTRIRNHALIHYIAKLAVSNHGNDTFDFAFVQSLLKNGADINATDKYGQTVFHEVARSWHADVAEFLLTNGANINQQDKYGRAPLHVSAAVDYVEMVEFLVSKGAEVNIRTEGELQTPIHFAAKNDACRSLKALIALGVDVNCRDYQDRTPLQLAAAMSRSKTARLLIEMGAPAGVYDKDGEMALSLLVIKMPDVAKIALDQLHSEDKINHKEYFFLNYLEGSRVVDGRSAARTPLEAAVVSKSVKVIMHPVIQRLIGTKWERFGKRWALFDFIVNMISAIIWTVMGVTLPSEHDELYHPLEQNWWRMVFAIIALLLTLHEILRQVITTVRTKRSLTQWKSYRESSLIRDIPFCHPQWPDEKRYVDSEVKRVREYRWLANHDRWIYVDWVTLLLIIASAISHVVFFTHGSRITHTTHVRLMCLLMIIIWVRILKFVRPFQETGAFVASFTKMLGDIFLALFLIAIIFLPYASCFWIIFGGLSPRPAEGFSKFTDVLYEVFQMTVLDTNHSIASFLEIDPFMARALSCTYIFISFVIVLNLIIAMITDTFKRVFSYAQEHAAMERAKTILNIEDSLRSKSRSVYWDYIRLHCSPFVLDGIDRNGNNKMRENMADCLKETYHIVEQRFGKPFGEDKISPIEEMVKIANQIVDNYAKSKEMLGTVSCKLKKLEDIVATMEVRALESSMVVDDVEINKENTSGNQQNFGKQNKNDSSRKKSQILTGASDSAKDDENDYRARVSRKEKKMLSKSTGHIGGMSKTDILEAVKSTLDSRRRKSLSTVKGDVDSNDENLQQRRRSSNSKSSEHVSKDVRRAAKLFKELVNRQKYGTHKETKKDHRLPQEKYHKRGNDEESDFR